MHAVHAFNIVHSQRTTKLKTEHWKSSWALLYYGEFSLLFFHIVILTTHFFPSRSQRAQQSTFYTFSTSLHPYDKHSLLVLGTERAFLLVCTAYMYWCITNVVIVAAAASLAECYLFFAGLLSFVLSHTLHEQRIRWLYYLGFVVCFSAFSILLHSFILFRSTERQQHHSEKISNVVAVFFIVPLHI